MTDLTPVIRRATEVDYEPLDAADGLAKGVLLSDADGCPHFAMRRFTLEPQSSVPKHTNTVEHEQYVLAGEYVVGIDDTEYTVEPGDAVFIPAGVVHWYRNETNEQGAFICAVPNETDELEIVE